MDDFAMNEVQPKSGSVDGVAISGMQEESVVQVKQEPMIKGEPEDFEEVPMVSVTQQQYSGSVVGFSVNEANNGPNIGDLYSTHAMLEVKAEAEVNVDCKNKLKSKEGQEPDDAPVENSAIEQKSKKGNDAPGSSIGKSKKKGMELKGRAKAVINAAHRKQAAAKRSKKQHKCSSCGYVTPWPSNLKKHMVKHTGEKPFPCNICAKQFTWKSSLQVHLKTHTDELPFSCSACLERFAEKEEKSLHEATCNRRRFECHLCKKSSTQRKSNLKIHMRMHTGEKPFRCNICFKEFNRKASLNRHLEIHTNPRPVKFQCCVCARNFSEEVERKQHEMKCKSRRYYCYLCKSYMTYQKKHIFSHMRAKHIDKNSYQCQVCKKSFTYESNLKRHQKNSHK